MGAFEHFPYTNFQDLNLDYILKQLKEIDAEVDSLGEGLESVKVTATAKSGADTSVDVSGGIKEGEINFDFTLQQETQASSTTPLMSGVANVGSELKYARGDHRHPSDTTKQDAITFIREKGMWYSNGELINKFSNLGSPDLNNIIYNYRGYVLSSTNGPSGVSANGNLNVISNATENQVLQMYSPFNANRIFIRHMNGDTWSTWSEFAMGNDSVYARLSGKKLVVVGDSLTQGGFYGSDYSWVYILRDLYGMTVVNDSVSGSAISTGSSGATGEFICNRALTTARANTDADFFIIEGGSNDFNGSCQLGGINDTIRDNFCGAINYIINGVRQIIPGVKLMFMTQYHRYDKINSINLMEINYVNSMVSCCSKKSIPCFNNWSSCGISLLDSDGMYWADGGYVQTGTRTHHFSKKAYEYLADIYAPWIAFGGAYNNSKANYMLREDLYGGNHQNFTQTFIGGYLMSNSKSIRFTIPSLRAIFASGVRFNTMYLTVRDVNGNVPINNVDVMADTSQYEVTSTITASGISVIINLTNAISSPNQTPLGIALASSDCEFYFN